MADVHNYYDDYEEDPLPSDPAVDQSERADEMATVQMAPDQGETAEPPPGEWAQIQGQGGRNLPVQTMGYRGEAQTLPNGMTAREVVLAAEDRPNARLPYGMSNREWRGLSQQERQQAVNDPEGMEVPRARQAADMQARQQEYLRQMQSMPLTQQEQVRLRRMQQGLSLIHERVASGEYSAEQGMDLEMQAMTGINPLMNRQHQAQIAQIQQHTQLEATRAAHLQIQDQQAAQFQASGLPERVGHVMIDGQRYSFLQTRPGHWERINEPREQRDVVTPQLEESVRGRIERQVDHELSNSARDAQRRNETDNGPAWMSNYDAMLNSPVTRMARAAMGGEVPNSRHDVRNMEIENRFNREMARLRQQHGSSGGGQAGGSPGGSSAPPPSSSPGPEATQAALARINAILAPSQAVAAPPPARPPRDTTPNAWAGAGNVTPF